MFEEALVCMTCGRPVDGQVYCSDECESLDSTSLSASASSSAQPSPYLPPSFNGQDVPPLMPSALGYPSLAKGHHRAHNSISSSSASSVGWSALSDEEDDQHPRIAGEGDMNDNGSIRSTSSSHLLKPRSGLFYARRPSATNHRSTVPILHRRTSSTSNNLLPTSVSFKSHQSGSLADYSAEEDFSDVPSGSISSSIASSVRSRKDTMRPSSMVESLDQQQPNFSLEQNAALKRKRDRTSLPAYFSLLQITSTPGSPPTKQSARSPRSPASLQTLNAISRSLHSTPTTPRIANPLVDLTSATGEPSRPAPLEATPRGRSRRRDPEGRSSSTRRSLQRSPPRHLAHVPTACPHHYAMGAQARARLNSVEKVADWVASSPVVHMPIPTARRNSSPPPKPKWEYVGDNGDAKALYSDSLQCAVVDDDDEEFSVPSIAETRGRRRVGELDRAPLAVGLGDILGGPGYGNGRSGLKRRELNEVREGREGRRGRW
ncbi:hypothetical protein QCA50_003387 [Cerrena zonata]|uniref:Uncharacterized protein n=1 Tax=Cerrena zonata TaxID=2478898 RepID=A0AAW0GS00_9APHY